MTTSATPPPAGTPPATPAAPATPKKPNPLVRIGAGCLSLIVLGCVLIGGFALYENWQQEQNYQTGHRAYAQADCAAAVEPLGKAARGEPGTRGNDVALQAQEELQECEALLAADERAGQQPADAVLGYSEVLTKYPESPLASVALTRGQELLASGAPADLATPPLCGALDTLTEQQLIAAPGETMPPLLYACGQAHEVEQAFADAVVFYDRFLSEYPEHELAGEVQAAFARATIADARASGAGELPPPQAVGGGGSGPVTVVIQNDSPETLSLVFSGPEVRVEKLEACADCEKFTGDGPSACPEQGPVGRYVLAPGTYEVVVKAISSSGVTPFRGSWTLESGQEYSSCFYLVTSGG
ncbi:MAG TPA: hypothetical protein VNL77_14655 [Roseiflexaceae bacterium]|nr:hypothetical protein [Roseiflexaceae bacterium]